MNLYAMICCYRLLPLRLYERVVRTVKPIVSGQTEIQAGITRANHAVLLFYEDHGNMLKILH